MKARSIGIFMASAVLLGRGFGADVSGLEKTMGALPEIDHRTPPEIQVLSVEKLNHYTRKKITYLARPGELVYAWLLIPFEASHNPAVLCLHQTTRVGKDEPAGIAGLPNLHYGDELALRGYVVLIPDYPSFGEDQTQFYRDVYSRGYCSGSMKGVVNHIRGVDLLVSLTEVDSKRIGVIGHSLGGHNSLYLAAFDPRIRAVVTSCGFTAKDRYLGGDLRGWSSDRYMPLVALNYHGRASELPWDFDDVLVAIAPRRIFVNAPVHDDNFDARGVDECVARARARVSSEFIIMKHPDCAHDFPQEIRMQAYEFLDRELTPEGVSQSPIRRTPGEVTSRRARS